MRECGNGPEAQIPPGKDSLLLERRQVRALARYFRSFHGADSFVTVLEKVRAQTEAGDLATAAVWNQIAEEISQMETSDILERCLSRQGCGA